jgi:hypothetical protein
MCIEGEPLVQSIGRIIGDSLLATWTVCSDERRGHNFSTRRSIKICVNRNRIYTDCARTRVDCIGTARGDLCAVGNCVG